MEKYFGMIDRIRRNVEFESFALIEAGYSFEKKILLKRSNEGNLLLRLKETDDVSDIKRKEKEFEVLKILGGITDKVPKAHLYGYDDELKICFMILDYVEGEDAESALKDYSEEAQYRMGLEAGKELKKMHSLAAPEEYGDWYGLKKRKYRRYCEKFVELDLHADFLDINRVNEFVCENMYLMKCGESKFQHDDFHPGNIIIANGEYKAAIDFNRYDWGDPIHDFYKTALFSRNVSVPFSIGQIDGYNQGGPDELFWKKYSLYNAMSIIPDMVWSYNYALKTGDTCQINNSSERLKIIYEDHEHFESDIPVWYHRYEK